MSSLSPHLIRSVLLYDKLCERSYIGDHDGMVKLVAEQISQDTECADLIKRDANFNLKIAMKFVACKPEFAEYLLDIYWHTPSANMITRELEFAAAARFADYLLDSLWKLNLPSTLQSAMIEAIPAKGWSRFACGSMDKADNQPARIMHAALRGAAKAQDLRKITSHGLINLLLDHAYESLPVHGLITNGESPWKRAITQRDMGI